jgi:hypothetical protein
MRCFDSGKVILVQSSTARKFIRSRRAIPVSGGNCARHFFGRRYSSIMTAGFKVLRSNRPSRVA